MTGRGGSRNPYELTEESPVYVISVAAQLSGLHPQTLRQYDRLGLVSPDRTAGRGRRYSARDIELLRQVQQLSQDEGINLAGIKRIIELENQVAAATWCRIRTCSSPAPWWCGGPSGVAGARSSARGAYGTTARPVTDFLSHRSGPFRPTSHR